MTFLIEAVILCVLFSLIVIISVTKNPLGWVADYPPEIGKRAKELGLIEYEASAKTPQFWAGKIIRGLFGAVIFAGLAVFVNKADTFIKGFLYSYGLWLVIAWFDALILDCLWFCHSKKVRIKGTEDMDKEYKNYMFHIKQSLLGSAMGIPVCLIAGGLTVLINHFMK